MKKIDFKPTRLTTEATRRQRLASSARTYHVMTRIGGGWSVRKEGTTRPTGTFDSKDQAIRRAREVARNGGGEVVIHHRDGLVQELTTYPAPSAAARTKHR
jgi:hypothetical protein